MSKMQTPGKNDTNSMRVLDYQRTNNSALCVTDRLVISASEEDIVALKNALEVLSRFEALVLSEFHAQRGYAANDSRHSDTFKEIYFWFKDGSLMASIRAGSVG